MVRLPRVHVLARDHAPERDGAAAQTHRDWRSSLCRVHVLERNRAAAQSHRDWTFRLPWVYVLERNHTPGRPSPRRCRRLQQVSWDAATTRRLNFACGSDRGYFFALWVSSNPRPDPLLPPLVPTQGRTNKTTGILYAVCRRTSTGRVLLVYWSGLNSLLYCYLQCAYR